MLVKFFFKSKKINKTKKKDLHGSWESFTGHHAALYPRNSETDAEQRLLNVDFALNYWVQLGTPREKINLGAASYGRTFRLVSTSQTGLGASASGPGTAGTVFNKIYY